MELNYAKRFDGITGSAIRDIFKLLTNPAIISFAGGNPANSALESDVVSRLAQKVLAEHGTQLLQYGQTEGYAPLRNRRRNSSSTTAWTFAPNSCCLSPAASRRSI